MADTTFTVTFWRLFHSLMRADKANIEEKDRARHACIWLTNELTSIRKACTDSEADLIGEIYDAWGKLKHAEAPSFALLKPIFLTDPIKEEWLREYEDLIPELERLSHDDLQALLTAKAEEYRLLRVTNAIKKAHRIATEGAEGPDPVTGRKVELKGADDAIRYFIGRMEAGFGTPSSVKVHGSLGKDAGMLLDHYTEITDPTSTKHKPIPTGIPSVDTKVQHKKGMFTGILGTEGAGKTTFARTWAYNAVKQGFNVMHFSFEQRFMEELLAYGIIHSHHPQFGVNRGLSVNAYRQGLLKQADIDFLRDEVIPDLEAGESLPGKLIIRQVTEAMSWDMVKTIIDITHRTTPLDMVIIDYFLQIQPKNFRDKDAETIGNIQDAKTFAMTFGGEGILLVTPVHGNREGLERAIKAQGRWDLPGINQYSQFGKAFDTCMYVFTDDDLQADNKVIVGSCKQRENANMAPTKLAAERNRGTFMDISTNVKVHEKVMDEILEDLGID